jgi:hypothetical protein
MPSTIGILKVLAGLAVIACLAYAAFALAQAKRLRDVMVNGTEAMALVEGGAEGLNPGTGETVSVDLVWIDKAGAERRVRRSIGNVLDKQLKSGALGSPPALLIKYEPEADDGAAVVVLEAAQNQEENRFHIVAALLGAGFSLLAFVLLAIFGRR